MVQEVIEMRTRAGDADVQRAAMWLDEHFHEQITEALVDALALEFAQARAVERSACGRSILVPLYPEGTMTEQVVAASTQKLLVERLRQETDADRRRSSP